MRASLISLLSPSSRERIVASSSFGDPTGEVAEPAGARGEGCSVVTAGGGSPGCPGLCSLGLMPMVVGRGRTLNIATTSARFVPLASASPLTETSRPPMGTPRDSACEPGLSWAMVTAAAHRPSQPHASEKVRQGVTREEPSQSQVREGETRSEKE